jgi:rod shape-determining protein MreC
VHDKQVRRRRAVLGLLVGASLILLTAYFGESESSPLHSIQRGIVEVLSPVQEGANKALSPVRDVASWFSSTLRAKSQRDFYKHKAQVLQGEVAKLKQYQIDYQQLSREHLLDTSNDINQYAPVAATVYERDPQLWYSTIEVDKGSDDGVHANDPVLSDGGLIGKVLTAESTVSVVQLISDHSMSVTAEVQNTTGAPQGELVPAVGDPNQMLLTFLPPHAVIQPGDTVVTAGFKEGKYDSLYPPAIPIGTVTQASQAEILSNQQVQVAPTADLTHISNVQILTRPQGATQSASTTGGGTTNLAQVTGG